MKITCIILLHAFLCFPAFAQSQMQEREQLQNLLARRADRFSAYTVSIQQRSGIFGNKTKRDLEKSNEVLMAIVTLDNDLMDALKKSLDYKTFERTEENFNVRDCEAKLKQSMQVTDTLMKQLTLMERKIKSQDAPGSVYAWLFYLLLAGCVLAVLTRYRRGAG